MWTKYFSQVLQNSFEESKRRNGAISLRAFARTLEVSPSVLSEILRNKRTISTTRALELAEKAKLDPMVSARLKNLMFSEKSAEESASEIKAVDLILNTLYYRVLCVFEVLPIPTTLSEIADFLEIELPQLKSILRDLEKFEVIKMKKDAIYWQGRYVTSSEDIPSEKIKAFHRETLKNAADDLKIPVPEREYTSITFAACASEILEAKKQIRNFREGLAEGMRTSKPDRIYQLSIQLRPLSKKLKEPQ